MISTRTSAKGDNQATVAGPAWPELTGAPPTAVLLAGSSCVYACLPTIRLLQSGFTLEKGRKRKFQEKAIFNVRHLLRSFNCKLNDAATHPITLLKPAED